MEAIEEFLKDSFGSGSGSGSGFGYGYGDDDGSGDGSGYGDDDGSGDGSGDGCGYGSGDGCGYGSGYGDGSGYGYGDGSGFGSGFGFGDGVKTFCGKNVYLIDDVQTIIESVRGNVAKGYILQNDLTLIPCCVVKENNMFSHGSTLREAFEALQEKLYDDSTEEERIRKFREHFPDFSKKYPARELFVWHHVLTGSCKAGREAFCRDKGIDVDKDEFTIHEFIKLTENSYNGHVIKKLKE